MKIFDISVIISPTLPVWPGDMKVQLERTKKMEEGAHDNLSRIAMGVHTGTHMDAPYHFVNDGAKINEIPLERFIGPCTVVEIADNIDMITSKEVEEAGIEPGTERVLFKTRNSLYWAHEEKRFQKEFVAISVDGAKKLVEMGLKFVGIDYLSIAPFGDSIPTHLTLLKGGMVLLEGANLTGVSAGKYTLISFPLKLSDTEGSPVRAILIQD